MSRRIIPLSDVDLPPRLRAKLLAVQLGKTESNSTDSASSDSTTANTLVSLPPSDIARRFQLSVGDTESLILACSAAIYTRPSATALRLMAPKSSFPRFITTGCPILDSALPAGRGVPTGSVTELYGEAGTAKSMLSMQLCAAVQLPVDRGGLDGAAIYFTTSKYFPAELLMAISRRLLGENCRDPATPLYRPGGQARREGTADMSPAITSSETTSPAVPHTAGSNVFVQTLEDDDHTVAHLTHLLPSLVRNAPKPVRLIVVDSIATHFREDGAGRGAGGGRGNPSRVQDLYECARSLKCVAESGFSPHGPVGMSRRSDLRRGAAPPPAIDPGIAVVVVNQVTARMSDIKSSGEPLGDLTGGEGLDARDGDATMPCLGPAWSNMVNTRMRMSKKAAVVMDNGAHVAGGDAKTGGEVGLRTFQERCLGIEFSSCAGRTAEVSFTVGADGLTGRST